MLSFCFHQFNVSKVKKKNKRKKNKENLRGKRKNIFTNATRWHHLNTQLSHSGPLLLLVRKQLKVLLVIK